MYLIYIFVVFALGLIVGAIVLVGQVLATYRTPKNKLW